MTWARYLLLAAVVVPLALAVRWGGDAELRGSRFDPWPDTVEYAAEAQALARSGQVFLQIGPYRVRPRFPPGWPLLLSPAVRFGMGGQDLWRITALFGAFLAWLLAAVTAAATAALGPHDPGPDDPSSLLPSPPPGGGGGIASLVAGLLAGCVWAISPIAIGLGSSLMSDEPTALVSLAGLLLAGAAFLRRPS